VAAAFSCVAESLDDSNHCFSRSGNNGCCAAAAAPGRAAGPGSAGSGAGELCRRGGRGRVRGPIIGVLNRLCSRPDRYIAWATRRSCRTSVTRHRPLRQYLAARRPAPGRPTRREAATGTRGGPGTAVAHSKWFLRRQAVAGPQRRRGRRCHGDRDRVQRTGTGTKAVPSPAWSG